MNQDNDMNDFNDSKCITQQGSSINDTKQFEHDSDPCFVGHFFFAPTRPSALPRLVGDREKEGRDTQPCAIWLLETKLGIP